MVDDCHVTLASKPGRKAFHVYVKFDEGTALDLDHIEVTKETMAKESKKKDEKEEKK